MMVQAVAWGSLRPDCRRMLGVVLLVAFAAIGPGWAQDQSRTKTAVPTDPSSTAARPTDPTATSPSPNATNAPSAMTAGNSSITTPDATTAALNVTQDRANVSSNVTAAPPPLLTTAATTATGTTSLQPLVTTTTEQTAATSEPAATVTGRLTITPSPTSGPEVLTTTPTKVTKKTDGGGTAPATSTPTGRTVPQGSSGSVALYLLLPVVIIAAVAVLVMIVSCLRKRIRLDKLRHQLLPLYNFDPQEGEDWETELLTEPRPSSQTPLNTTKPLPTTTAIAEIPKLRFSPDTVDV